MKTVAALFVLLILSGCQAPPTPTSTPTLKSAEQPPEWLMIVARGETGWVYHCKIIQIIGEADAVVDAQIGDQLGYVKEHHIAWLSGEPTATRVDGQDIGPVKVRVDGTKRYDSVLGPRTVPLLIEIP